MIDWGEGVSKCSIQINVQLGRGRGVPKCSIQINIELGSSHLILAEGGGNNWAGGGAGFFVDQGKAG